MKCLKCLAIIIIIIIISISFDWVSLSAELSVVLLAKFLQLPVPPTQLHLAELVWGVREFSCVMQKLKCWSP